MGYDLRVERCPRARSIGMRRTEDAMAQRDGPTSSLAPRLTSAVLSRHFWTAIISGAGAIFASRGRRRRVTASHSPLSGPSLSFFTLGFDPPAPTLGGRGRGLFPLSLAVRVVLQSSTC